MAALNPFFGDVDRLFDEMTRGLGGSASAPSFGAVDAALDAETGVLTAHLDLPGVDRDSLLVRVVGDALVVEASRNRAGSPGRVISSERAAGRVRRVVRTGRPLAAEEVSASYDDGVLTVTASTRSPGHEVPVSFGASPRRAEVEGALVEQREGEEQARA